MPADIPALRAAAERLLARLAGQREHAPAAGLLRVAIDGLRAEPRRSPELRQVYLDIDEAVGRLHRCHVDVREFRLALRGPQIRPPETGSPLGAAGDGAGHA